MRASFIALFFSLFASLAIGGCARLTLAWASLDASGRPAAPPVLGAFMGAPEISSVAQWEDERVPALREAFQLHVYGYFPDESATHLISHVVVDEAAFEGLGVFEDYEIQVTAVFDGEAADSETFWMELTLPKDSPRPVPIVIMQTYCERDFKVHPAVTGGGPGVSCYGGVLSKFMRLAFGRGIATAPIEQFLEQGYGVAVLYPRAVIPDRPREGLDALDALAPARAESDKRWGAIAAWAWLYSRMIDLLERDDRIDPRGIIVLGHSRYAKSALVAAAFDERIDAVISNQSGTAGAALNRSKTGETIRQITQTFPHWFATTYDDYAGREDAMPVDQHQLLALIAPRPIFLGNARRDVWSDPNGTFRAAIGADPVYRLYGVTGLDQSGMRDYNPGAGIAYRLRSGTHMINDSDWKAFIEFLNAHFKRTGG
jgi:hypothetical protein